jgi:hypothetical protein
VTDVDVELASGNVTVTGEQPVDAALVRAAVGKPATRSSAAAEHPA